MSRVIVLMLLSALSACASAPKTPQPTFDAVEIDRFLGRWYVIANIPYFAERGRVGSFVEYHRRPDGRFDDLFFSRKGDFDAPIKQQSGVAWIPDPDQGGRWKVRFFWPFTADFLLLYADEDYQTALIGHPSRDLAWVYSRSPEMSDADYAALLARLSLLGYDITRLQRVPQHAEDLGKPGYSASLSSTPITAS